MSDVFLPGPEEVRAAWTDGTDVEGTIIDFSDSGSVSRVFAVIEAHHRHTVIVPVAKLRLRKD